MFEDLSDYDFGWIVGILEGEGCFFVARHFRNGKPKRPLAGVRVSMTDEDTMLRFHEVIGCGRLYSLSDEALARLVDQGRKAYWQWMVHGKKAEELMLRVKPEMSERRQQKISEIFEERYGSSGNLSLDLDQRIQVERP